MAAALDQTRLDRVTDEQMSKINAPENALGTVATADRLTVWRTLHLEFDSMAQGELLGIGPMTVTGVTSLSSPHGSEKLAILAWAGDKSGTYEGGRWEKRNGNGTIIASGTIIDNVPPNWDGNRDDNSDFCNAIVVSSGAALSSGDSVTVYQDDQAVLPHLVNHALSRCQAKYRPAFLEVQEEPGVSDTDVTFQRVIPGTTDYARQAEIVSIERPRRDLLSQQQYWTATVLSAYEFAAKFDHDPNTFFHQHGDSWYRDSQGYEGCILGWACGFIPEGAEDNVCAVFCETSRDYDAFLLGPIPEGYRETFGSSIGTCVSEDCTVAHELGHLFGLAHRDSSGTIRSIMDLGEDIPFPQESKPKALFWGADLKTIRTSNRIGVDGE